MSEKVIAHFKMTRAVIDDAESAALAAASEHLHQLDSLRLECSELTAENARLSLENAESRKAAAGLFATCERLRSEREAAVAELDHVREQLGSALCAIEKAATEAAERVVYANVDTSLSDPHAGRLLVIRIDEADARDVRDRIGIGAWRDQFVGWLEAAQDEGDTETRAVDVHHEGLPMPVASAATTPEESAANKRVAVINRSNDEAAARDLFSLAFPAQVSA